MSIPKLTPEQQERVRLLVQTLRSGKYRQTRYTMSRYYRAEKKKRHCCLGVACNVAISAGLDVRVNRDEYGYFAYDGAESTLPSSVQDWYGFKHNDPILLDEQGDEVNASMLNDLQRHNFSKIADAFERTYLNNNAKGDNE